MRPAPRPASIALLAAALLLPGCRERAPTEARMDLRLPRAPGTPPGPPVATWSGDALTAGDVRQRLEELSPAQRERYQTLEARREYVEGLARHELLVQEALARGLQDDPEVVAATRRALVSRLMRAEMEERAPPPSEEALARAYAEHLEDYVRPEQVRLTHVFLATPAQGEALMLERAQALLTRARALPPRDFSAFGRLAREYSEEPSTQPLDGDLRYRSFEQLTRDFGPEVADAARALLAQGPGALSAPVRTGKGVHLLQLTGHQPALNQTLEDVRAALSGRLQQEQRSRAWSALMARLERRAGLTLDAAALSRVPVDLGAPVRPPGAASSDSLPAPFPSVQVTPP